MIHETTDGASVTQIDTANEVATLVNVFAVAPEDQEELVKVLEDATEQVMRHLPGFVSANIHTSLDGTRVVNYAQWRSADDFQKMMSNSAAGEHMQRAADIANHYDPNLYRVSSIHHASHNGELARKGT